MGNRHKVKDCPLSCLNTKNGLAGLDCSAAARPDPGVEEAQVVGQGCGRVPLQAVGDVNKPEKSKHTAQASSRSMSRHLLVHSPLSVALGGKAKLQRLKLHKYINKFN